MREFHKRGCNGRLTLREFLYLCYFYNHLKSLGVYECFIEEGRDWVGMEIHDYIEKCLIFSRNSDIKIRFVDKCLRWHRTREGYDFWRDINAKVAPFLPDKQRW